MRIVLVGKSCSGKTEISFLLREMGLKIATSSTSRPARIGEVDGVDYHFKKPEDFVRSIEEDSFIEYDVFNGWYYGVDREEFNKCDVLILTPRGLKHLFKNQDRREVLGKAIVELGEDVDPSHTFTGKKLVMRYKCYGQIVEREMTFKSFVRNYPEGTYIIIVKNHAFCLRDGVVIGGNVEDTQALKKRIHSAFKVN